MSEWADRIQAQIKELREAVEGLHEENRRAGIVKRDEAAARRSLDRGNRFTASVPGLLFDTVGSAAAAQAASQPLDAELTALAGLASAADKVPYFTGSGTAALADFTSAGRALVDDASAAAQRATLGITTAPTNLVTNLTQVLSTATTSEEDLMTYTLPGGTLAATKDRVEIVAWGAFGAAARTKEIKLYFGSTVLFDTAAVLLASSDWQIRATVYRTGAATQIAVAAFDGDTTLVTTTSLRTAPGETLSGDVVIKITSTVGAGATAGDTRQTGFLVNYGTGA